MDQDFVSTGVPGVDELLEGKGFPRGHSVFLLGGPGTGKTTFGLQFLYQGARKFGENGVYITLDNNIQLVKTNSKRLGMDLDSQEKGRKLVLIDASPIRRAPGPITVGEYSIGKGDFTLASLMDMIKHQVKTIGAKRVVVDPLVSLTLEFPEEAKRRTAVLGLMQAIAETSCTSLLITELSESSVERKYQFEEYLAQGVVMMRKVQKGGSVIRIFQVEKMKGVAHDDQAHPYKIEQGGVTVYNKETAF